MKEKKRKIKMNWSEFIKKISDGLFGERYSDYDLANKTGVLRENIYNLRMRRTLQPRQSTITKIEKAFDIKIFCDGDKLSYVSLKYPTLEEVTDRQYPIITNLEQQSKINKSAHGYMHAFENASDKAFWIENYKHKYCNLISYEDKIFVDPQRELRNNDLAIILLSNQQEIIRRVYFTPENMLLLYTDDCSESPLLLSNSQIVKIYKISKILKTV